MAVEEEEEEDKKKKKKKKKKRGTESGKHHVAAKEGHSGTLETLPVGHSLVVIYRLIEMVNIRSKS